MYVIFKLIKDSKVYLVCSGRNLLYTTDKARAERFEPSLAQSRLVELNRAYKHTNSANFELEQA